MASAVFRIQRDITKGTAVSSFSLHSLKTSTKLSYRPFWRGCSKKIFRILTLNIYTLHSSSLQTIKTN